MRNKGFVGKASKRYLSMVSSALQSGEKCINEGKDRSGKSTIKSGTYLNRFIDANN